jgi:transcriptional regulator with XRE-family HTH domain
MLELKKFLEVNEITYREFAKIIGTSIFTLTNILNGIRLPSLKLAINIEKATLKKITVYDWLTEKDNKNRTTDTQKKRTRKNKS